jgi:hypothetical protein
VKTTKQSRNKIMEKGTEMVLAHKPGMPQAKFTALAWERMGKDKNGWAAVTPEKPKGLGATVKADTDPQARYLVAMSKGAGFEADGKLDKALTEYARGFKIIACEEAAVALKRVETVMADMFQGAGRKGKTVKAAPLTTPESDDLIGDEVLISADKAFADEDYVLAKELYEAVENQDSEHVKGRLLEIAALLVE